VYLTFTSFNCVVVVVVVMVVVVGASQLNVDGLSVPSLQLRDATDGLCPKWHWGVHEEPEVIVDPWLQAPPVA
jgi:hypothetical protein